MVLLRGHDQQGLAIRSDTLANRARPVFDRVVGDFAPLAASQVGIGDRTYHRILELDLAGQVLAVTSLTTPDVGDMVAVGDSLRIGGNLHRRHLDIVGSIEAIRRHRIHGRHRQDKQPNQTSKYDSNPL